MKTIQQIFILMIAVQLVGCIGETIRPSGVIEQEEYIISGYSKLEVSNAFKATVEFGSEESIIIRADDNLMPYVQVIHSGDKLSIQLINRLNIFGNGTLEATIITNNINSYKASGASFITVNSPIVSSDISIDLSGASRMSGYLTSESLHVELSGASIVDLAGTTAHYQVDVSGASTVRDYSLSTDYLNANLSGASLFYATVTNEIDATISGASNLYFKGDGMVDRKAISGGSSIHHKN